VAQWLTDDELRHRMDDATRRLGGWTQWVHVGTGGVYVVEGPAFEEATLGVVVIYHRGDAPALRFTRPIDEFLARFELKHREQA
jgi:hypothetical protein